MAVRAGGWADGGPGGGRGLLGGLWGGSERALWRGWGGLGLGGSGLAGGADSLAHPCGRNPEEC